MAVPKSCNETVSLKHPNLEKGWTKLIACAICSAPMRCQFIVASRGYNSI